MRSLAVARYRFLTTNRTSVWILLVTVLVTGVVAGVAATFGELVNALRPDSMLDWAPSVEAGTTISISGRILEVSYFVHVLLLTGASVAFGSRDTRQDDLNEANLMDSAPITEAARFCGDALGIFAATMVVHLAALPLLVFAFTLSPFPTSWIVWPELAIIAFVALRSVEAAWSYHASRGGSSMARSSGSILAFAILLFLAVRAFSSWPDLRDAVTTFAVWPSPRAVAAIAATINSPALLAFSLVAIWGCFTYFMYVRGVRALERS